MINRGRFRLFAGSTKEYSARAVDILERTTVIDMLGLLTLDWRKLRRWQQVPGSFTEADFQKLLASGISIFHPAVELPAREDSFGTAWNWLCGLDTLITSYPRYFVRVENVADLDRAKSERKIGVVLGMQNAEHFRTCEDVVRFYSLGQRISQLTYNTRNQLGCGCMERSDTGLTEYGVSVIAEMNRLGMAVDISHAGDRTALDACAASCKPLLVTHTNCRSLVPRHPRCQSDEAIKMLAACGSVIGMTGIRTFVRNTEPTTIEHMLDHFDHVARLAGVEHVGVGSDTDLDGRDRSKATRRFDIEGLDHPQRIYDLAEGLIRRKYSDDDIELMLGGNFRRVLAEIWTPPPVPAHRTIPVLPLDPHPRFGTESLVS
jgi:membrane dipeptidase